MFGEIWTFLEKLGNVWRNWEIFREIGKCLEELGNVRRNWKMF